MRNRRLLVGELFITLALSTAPTLAQDLSHCNSADPNELVCLSLTVAEDSGEFGYVDGNYGSLAPDNLNFFDYNGETYEIETLYYLPDESPPLLIFVDSIFDGAFDGQSDLRLMLGTVELSFPTGTFDVDKGEYSWENPGLSWSDGDVIPVKLFLSNAAPTASNGTVTMNEDTDYAFTASDFNFVGSGDELASVKILTLPANGELQLNNVAIGSVPQTVTKAQLDASNLKYIPPANAYGTDYTSFTFKVSDGTLDSEDTYTMTIDVNEVPTLTNRRRVWQQTLTVGLHKVGADTIAFGWFRPHHTGTLTGQSEPINLGTNRYQIGDQVLLYDPSDGVEDLLSVLSESLVLHLVGETNPDAHLTATEQADLVLHVDSQELTFANATHVGDGHYAWASTGLTWSNGLEVTLTLSMPQSSSSQQIITDQDPPQVDGTPQVSGAGTDGSWSAGESVEVALSFNEAVDVDISDGTPSLEIRLGGTEVRSAEYLSGSGTSELAFSYTLANSESSYTLMSVTPNSLALNGGTIRSAETQVDALLAHVGTVVQGTGTRSDVNNGSGTGTRSDVNNGSGLGAKEQNNVNNGNSFGAAGGDTPITAEFTQVPSSHDGSTAFQVQISFSEEVSMSYATMRDEVLDVSGGSVTKARRVAPPSNIGWEITVVPSSNADVTISLSATTDCNATGAVCTSDDRALSNSLSQIVTGPGPSKAVAAPLRLELDANYPNPFNTETQIAYTLPAAGQVELAIYNVLGQRQRTLVQAVQSAGRYQIAWDGRNDMGAPIASGVYLYRLTSEQGFLVRQLLLLK